MLEWAQSTEPRYRKERIEILGLYVCILYFCISINRQRFIFSTLSSHSHSDLVRPARLYVKVPWAGPKYP
jgi:hypothetical protein